MSDKCGATDTADGEPCENPACRSDGRCWMHTKADEQADVGRDSKLTRDRQEAIAALIEEGQSIEAAARANNIHPSNVFEWVAKGEEQDEGIYAEFRERFTRAKGIREQNYFELIKELAREQGDHRFLMSMLKRRHPESWGDTETGVESDTIELNITEDVADTFPE